MQIVDCGDRVAGERDDDVAVEYAGGGRRTVRLDRRDQHARRDRELVSAGDARAESARSVPPRRCNCGESRRRASGATPRIATVLLAIAKHRPCAGRIIAVLMPITSPRVVHERSAGIAGIERGVGLDDVVHQPSRSRPQRSAERADDAGGDRVLKAVRVADRDGDLARTNDRASRRASPTEMPRRPDR